ncbi:SIS domain-containing protein [Temperatibacter marinus]|uniref:SIS domain-containing protein n=1 Tax=Temperatibacter marinus TaxID=1456591 RepID=A0AA52EJR2_9PROT|nr:SIS domain-containing protein [Temperatibacter marinus]WND04075.1 SIS domain-containing protein [Temperatibacter marinus]
MSLSPNKTLMYSEALEASAVVAKQFKNNRSKIDALVQELKSKNITAIATCARGSSDHAATYAKYLFETRLGLMTCSLAPSINSVYQVSLNLKNMLFIAISQSGASPDLLATAEAAKEAGAVVVAFVNVEDSPLAKLADHFIPLYAGPEKSVAATKSYIASLSALYQFGAYYSGDDALIKACDDLPDQLSASAALDWAGAEKALQKASNFFVIGRGTSLGIAQEAALKFKETSGLHAEAYSAAEVKHGPMAIVNEGFPILAFTQDDETRESVDNVIEDFLSRGATVMVAGKEYEGAINLPIVQGAHKAVSPLLKIQSFYLMVNSLAVSRGYNPDEPPHLKKVTETV